MLDRSFIDDILIFAYGPVNGRTQIVERELPHGFLVIMTNRWRFCISEQKCIFSKADMNDVSPAGSLEINSEELRYLVMAIYCKILKRMVPKPFLW